MAFYGWAAGQLAKLLGDFSIANGYEAEAGEDSTATGFRAKAPGKTCSAYGSGTNAGGVDAQSNTVIGDDCIVLAADDVAATGTGRLARVGKFAVANGHDAQVENYGTGVGEGVRVLHAGGGGFGRAATTTRNDQLMLGSVSSPYKEVNISERVVWRNGTGAPSDAAPSGSLHSRSDGPPYLYVYEGSQWVSK